jgi:hypothetical protein
MRHIRLFEGFKKDTYYNEITEDDFYNMLTDGIDSNSKLEDIGLDYFEKLKGYDSDMNIRIGKSNRISSVIEKVVRIVLIDSSGKVFFRSHMQKEEVFKKKPQLGYYFEIYGFSDEWFLVFFADYSKPGIEAIYYKCDQFDGLTELLKNKEIIK